MGQLGSKEGIPAGSGPHHVGCQDLLIPGGLLVRFYYPAQVDQTVPSPWFPRHEYLLGTGTFLGQRPWLFASYWYGSVLTVRVPVTAGAGVKEGGAEGLGERLPLVIFSHGLGAFRGAYVAVCADLASHGFLVASVEHRDRSAAWTYDLDDDGNELPTEYSTLLIQDFPARNSQIKQRIEEVVRTLGLVRELDGRGAGALEGKRLGLGGDFDWDSLKGRVDVERAAVVGHSFGGGTALGALAACGELRAGVMLDAWLYPLDREIFSDKAAVAQPLFFLNASEFQWPDNLTAMRRFWSDASGSERVMWTIKDSLHAMMSDFGFILNWWMGKFMTARNDSDPWDLIRLSNRLTRAFLNKHLGLGGETVEEVAAEKAAMLVRDTESVPVAPVDPDLDRAVDDLRWSEKLGA